MHQGPAEVYLLFLSWKTSASGNHNRRIKKFITHAYHVRMVPLNPSQGAMLWNPWSGIKVCSWYLPITEIRSRMCSKKNWREPSVLNLWNLGYPAQGPVPEKSISANPWSKKTLLKIWLNPGTNLTIFWGTGPSIWFLWKKLRFFGCPGAKEMNLRSQSMNQIKLIFLFANFYS